MKTSSLIPFLGRFSKFNDSLRRRISSEILLCTWLHLIDHPHFDGPTPLINIFASSVALLLCISDARLLLCISDARTSSIQIGRSRTDLSSESTKRSMRLFFLDYFAENLI